MNIGMYFISVYHPNNYDRVFHFRDFLPIRSL